MTKAQYEAFEALNPFFGVVMEGIAELVDGKHYFDAFAEDAIFESRYHFPGWPTMIRGRANLMASFTGYGNSIKLHSGDKAEAFFGKGLTQIGEPLPTGKRRMGPGKFAVVFEHGTTVVASRPGYSTVSGSGQCALAFL